MGAKKLVSLASVLLIAAVSCGPNAPPLSGETEIPNAELNVGLVTIGAQSDPHLGIDANSQHFFHAVFDPLVFVDPQGALQPGLALSWRNVDPTTWEFKLRDAKFSNGDSFSAKDVIFTVNRVLDPATKSPVAPKILTTDKAVAVDDKTVRVTTKRPDPILPRRFASVFIVPADYFARVGAAEFAVHPVGTGPFGVVEYLKRERVTLTRAANSWRNAKLAKLTLIELPEIATRVAALQRGEIDVAGSLAGDQVDLVTKAGFSVVAGQSARTCMVNMNNGYAGPLADTRVRLALNYAVDKAAIVKNILRGYGSVADGWIGPDGFGYDPSDKAFPYDPAKAKAMLADAGYANGFSVTLNGTKNSYISDTDVIQAVVGYLSDVGVKANVAIQDSATGQTFFFGGLHKEMVFHCLNYFIGQDAEQLYGLYRSDYPAKLYNNPTFDQMQSDSATLMNAEQRLAKLREISKLLHAEPPSILLYHEPVLYGVAKNVRGLSARPDSVMRFDTVYRVR